MTTEYKPTVHNGWFSIGTTKQSGTVTAKVWAHVTLRTASGKTTKQAQLSIDPVGKKGRHPVVPGGSAVLEMHPSAARLYNEHNKDVNSYTESGRHSVEKGVVIKWLLGKIINGSIASRRYANGPIVDATYAQTHAGDVDMEVGDVVLLSLARDADTNAIRPAVIAQISRRSLRPLKVVHLDEGDSEEEEAASNFDSPTDAQISANDLLASEPESSTHTVYNTASQDLSSPSSLLARLQHKELLSENDLKEMPLHQLEAEYAELEALYSQREAVAKELHDQIQQQKTLKEQDEAELASGEWQRVRATLEEVAGMSRDRDYFKSHTGLLALLDPVTYEFDRKLFYEAVDSYV